MNRILDRKVAAAGFDVSVWMAKAVGTIGIQCATAGADKCIDYAEVSDVCARLLFQIAQYNTLVKVRAELGEE